MEILLETYNDIQECRYKNEHYSVRDNGAVLRHAANNKRTRPTDNKWTFGYHTSPNLLNLKFSIAKIMKSGFFLGYMFLTGEWF